MSPRLNSYKLICLTVKGLFITNTECHFQFQNSHSVTHTNIESKDTSRLKTPKESSAQNYL